MIRGVQQFITLSQRVLQILSEQAKGLYKIAIFHCFEIVLKSLLDVVNYLHNLFGTPPPVAARRPTLLQLREVEMTPLI